jgi:hypothetical protein
MRQRKLVIFGINGIVKNYDPISLSINILSIRYLNRN